MPTRIPVATRISAPPPVSERIRHTAGGISGCRASVSTRAKAASSATASPPSTSVRAEPQPCSAAPSIA